MANRPAIKMKVPVSTLLDNARQYREELIEEGEAKLQQYADELAVFRGKVADKLHEAAAKADDIDDLDDFEWAEQYTNGRYRETAVKVEVGERPQKPDVVDREQVDRDIALLSATSEETLTLTVEDHFARYLRSK